MCCNVIITAYEYVATITCPRRARTVNSLLRLPSNPRTRNRTHPSTPRQGDCTVPSLLQLQPTNQPQPCQTYCLHLYRVAHRWWFAVGLPCLSVQTLLCFVPFLWVALTPCLSDQRFLCLVPFLNKNTDQRILCLFPFL